jgi:hypothetical protein
VWQVDVSLILTDRGGLRGGAAAKKLRLIFLFLFHVPKCEIFDRSDFHIFTPESLSGLLTLGLKYKLVTLNFRGARHHLISDAYAERS